jgi:hypothetical protein
MWCAVQNPAIITLYLRHYGLKIRLQRALLFSLSRLILAINSSLVALAKRVFILLVSLS